MVSLDCEATGLDLRHGAKPYFVTMCDEGGNLTYFEWDVNPLTREPDKSQIRDDLHKIHLMVERSDYLVLQNPKFDVTALSTVWTSSLWEEWDWNRTYDTLMAAHLLASNRPKDLTSLALTYLGIDLLPLDKELKRCCEECRRLCRRDFPHWRIASKDLPEMPSAKEKVWKYDGWLPRRIAQELGYDEEHEYWTVLGKYANADSAATMALWPVMRAEIERRGLWKIYLERLKLLPVIYRMEERGITINGGRLEKLIRQYTEESEKSGKVCLSIAKDYGFDLTLPKSGNNKSLREFCFNSACLNLPHIKTSPKTGEPSLDKSVLDEYEATLSPRSRSGMFIRLLKDKRRRDVLVQYMISYKRFWLPCEPDEKMKRTIVADGLLARACRENREIPDWQWYRLHPSVNPTGTDTVRSSSSNPNEQNIEKSGVGGGHSLRYPFGPAPGREWYSLDGDNLELRIPAYVAGEEEMIELFEKPDDSPYYGSYHLLVFDVLHPKMFAEFGAECKNKFKSTWYQWVKNGNFAILYGAVESSGTADRAYHVPGAQRQIEGRFPKIKQLNDRMISQADKLGYVETLPNKRVDSEHGYPLLCTRSEWGKILPTVPLNYMVQGTACEWKNAGMIKCQEQLDAWDDGYIIMDVHDELVFDFPKGTSYRRIEKMQELMESCGDDIGVPITVGISYHPDNWSEVREATPK